MVSRQNDLLPWALRRALTDAALDEGAWEAVHREVGSHFGTDLVHTLCVDPRTGVFTQNRIHGDPEAERKFLGVKRH
jgi:hypothetical protein